MYLNEMVSYYMVPTSLPGDNYALVSDYLRNMETRSDLSLLALREVDFRQTLIAVSNRETHGPRAIPEEPFDLHERCKALRQHWDDFRRDNQLPPEWDLAFDTTYIPPLIALGEGEEPPMIVMTEKEQAFADAKFNGYLEMRERKLRYFSKHSPKPISFKPAPGLDKQAAFGSVCPSGQFRAGVQLSGMQLMDKSQIWPIWTSASWDMPPFEWLFSDFKSDKARKGENGDSASEEARKLKDNDITNGFLDEFKARRAKQAEYQDRREEVYRANQKEL